MHVRVKLLWDPRQRQSIKKSNREKINIRPKDMYARNKFAKIIYMHIPGGYIMIDEETKI